MRCWPQVLLTVTSTIALFVSLPMSASAQNNVCQGVTPFYMVLPRTTAPSYAFCYSGMPDLDQTRNIGGNILPGNGEMYCAPTTSIDWMINLYNENFIGIIPAPPNGNQYDFTYDTNLINQMGSSAYMQTSTVYGTYGDPFQSGVIKWLNTNLPSVPFNVNFLQGSAASAPPLLSDMANTVVNNWESANISAIIGWYCSNDDPNNPGAVYRCGGHVVPLTAAWLNLEVLPDAFVGINDPDWPGIVGPPQSAFTTNIYRANDVLLSVASCPNGIGPCPGTRTVQQTMTNLIGFSSGNGYFDGALEMVPTLILSYNENEILGAWARGSEIRLPVCQACIVRALSIHSLSRDADYLVNDSDSIYRWEPASKQNRVVASVPGAMHLAAGGFDDNLYVTTPHLTLRLNRRGEIVNQVESSQTDAIAFDELKQSLVSLSRETRVITRFSSDLNKRVTVNLESDVCQDSPADAPVRLSISETSGDIWARCDGSPTVAKVVGERVVQIRLVDTENASGLFVNGQSHILVSVNNRLVEFDGNGTRVKVSYFSGIPVGRDVQFSRSVSNVNLKLLVGRSYDNITPSQNLARQLKLLKPEKSITAPPKPVHGPS
jgi:hypothetical protein